MTFLCGECAAFVQRMDWKVWQWNRQASAFALRTLPSFMWQMSGDCAGNGLFYAANEFTSFSEHFILFDVSVDISFQVSLMFLFSFCQCLRLLHCLYVNMFPKLKIQWGQNVCLQCRYVSLKFSQGQNIPHLPHVFLVMGGSKRE